MDATRERNPEGYYDTRPPDWTAKTWSAGLGEGLRLCWSLRRELDETWIHGYSFRELAVDVVDRGSVIGYLRATRVRLRAGHRFIPEHFIDACGSRSPELTQLATDLARRARDATAAALEAGPIFAVDAFELRPSHQGQGLGARAFRLLEDRVFRRSGARACFVRPAPPQFESAGLGPLTRRRAEAARRKLIAHARRHAPLERVHPASPYWVIAYDPVRPSGPSPSAARSGRSPSARRRSAPRARSR